MNSVISNFGNVNNKSSFKQESLIRWLRLYSYPVFLGVAIGPTSITISPYQEANTFLFIFSLKISFLWTRDFIVQLCDKVVFSVV